MSTTLLCPQCQLPLSPDAPDGLCPQCLLMAASCPLPSAAGDGLPADIIDIGDPAEVGKKLPQFEILELLGRGGMGVVYKARQLQLDRLVALKILPPVDALTPDFVARFTREARSLAKLNHPNIVNVYEFGDTGGLYYIVMEYVEGSNLRQLFQERKLTSAEALAIVPKICDALQYAHEEGLVHRDIKPENLLIDKKGRVKIADFGLAKLLRREPLDMTLTLCGTTLGTMRYMAPEQMDKPETVDHRADLYSLGVVIYEMLTGETPMGRFELPSQKAQVDVRFDEIVLHALEREPDRRYQHASQVREDVEKVTSKPTVVPPSSPRPPAPTPAREAQPVPVVDSFSEPRLSRLALIGVIWAALGIVATVVWVLWNYFYAAPPTPATDVLVAQVREIIYYTPKWPVFLLALTAPFGATICGAIAIAQIKRSGGKLYGLRLAAADAIFFPLLVVGAIAFYITNLIAFTIAFNLHTPVALSPDMPPERGLAVIDFAVLDAFVALSVMFFAGRAAWRAISGYKKPDAVPSVTAPAVWMLVGAVASTIMVLFLMSETYPNYTKGQFSTAGMAIRYAVLCAFAVLAVMTIRGALKMLNKEDHAASRQAALCSIFSIFGIITLPVGIWALVRLNKPEVKALFPQRGPELQPTISSALASPQSPRHLLSAALVLLCLFGLFFGLSFQAKTGGTAAGVTEIITVGTLDPLFVREKGPSGFQTGFNFFSWSFFAVVVGGIAFCSVWRIGREDQGKVPNDPAWWRNWWKQVGIWGGLLLIACIIRTVMDPAKVLQPPGERSVSAKYNKPLEPQTGKTSKLPDGGESTLPATGAAEVPKQPFMIGSSGPELTNEAIQKLNLTFPLPQNGQSVQSPS